ncbi:MAG TPA: hypothetical protein G4O05_08230 [Caldilineae bacterium]|nr:hypothetical protein [Caldilineae bacterium]
MPLPPPVIPPQQTRSWLLDAEIIIQLHAWEGWDALIEIADALACAPALTAVVVFDHPQALDGVRELIERTDGRMLVGMSHVETAEDVLAAAEAGAGFVLASQLRPQAWKQARDLDLLYIPGVFSRAEVALAREAGLTTQFLFPADILGPDHLRELRQAHPEVHFLPGVDFEIASLPAYRAAGAAAMVVELAVLSDPNWRQADVITYVRELLKAWRSPLTPGLSSSPSPDGFGR